MKDVLLTTTAHIAKGFHWVTPRSTVSLKTQVGGDELIIRPENSIISVDHTSLALCSCMKKVLALDATAAAARVAVVTISFGAVATATAATC